MIAPSKTFTAILHPKTLAVFKTTLSAYRLERTLDGFFKLGSKGTYECAGFRGELWCIHIISQLMRVVVTDGIIVGMAKC